MVFYQNYLRLSIYFTRNKNIINIEDKEEKDIVSIKPLVVKWIFLFSKQQGCVHCKRAANFKYHPWFIPANE